MGKCENLQELTGRESGIVLVGDVGIICNWSGYDGIPTMVAPLGLMDTCSEVPQVPGKHVDAAELRALLEGAELWACLSDPEAGCPEGGGMVYELPEGVIVIAPDGWI